jgi:hypothetical protein
LRGLSREHLVDMIHRTAGKDDVSMLSKSEASMLLSELNGTNGGAR